MNTEGLLDPVQQIRLHAPVRRQHSISRLQRVRVRIPRSDLGCDAYARLILAVRRYLDRTLIISAPIAVPLFVRLVSKSVENRQAAGESSMKVLNCFVDLRLIMTKYALRPLGLIGGGIGGNTGRDREKGAG